MTRIALIVIVISMVVGVSWIASIKPTMNQSAPLQNKWKDVYCPFWITTHQIEANAVITDQDLEPFPTNTITNRAIPETPVAPHDAIGRRASHRISSGTILGQSDLAW